MDERSQAQFDSLVKKEPQELTLESLKFLFGRQSYMTKDQFEKFSDKFEEIKALNEGTKKEVKKTKEVKE